MFHSLKKLLLCLTVLTTQGICSDQKPSSSLFEAMDSYEQKDMTKAANIFSQYIGQSTPIAESFISDLETKGHLQLKTSQTKESYEERQKAKAWHDAICQRPDLAKTIQKKPEQLKKVIEHAEKAQNGPLLYVIGTLYEREKDDKNQAIAIYKKALKHGDPRAIMALNRLEPEASIELGSKSVLLKVLYLSFELGKKLAYTEAEALFKIANAFKKNNTAAYKKFLYLAAQFGHLSAQLLWSKNFCRNEEEVLFWMMQAANQDNLEGLGLVGHFFEQGKGTSIDYEKAFHYLHRAAHHAEAKAMDFWNLANMYEYGKGTELNRQQALYWHEKTYNAEPNNKEYASHYGRLLALNGEYQLAIKLLKTCKDYDDETAYSYAFLLFQHSSQKAQWDEDITLFETFAEKGHPLACCTLASLYITKEKEYDREKLIDMITKSLSMTQDSKKKALLYFCSYVLNVSENQLLTEARSNLITKAYESDPTYPPIILSYGRNLKERGFYRQALDLFLQFQNLKEENISNDIGACYTNLAVNEKNLSTARKLNQQASEYFLDALEFKKCSDWPMAAYNLFRLYFQENLDEETNNETLYKYLQIAAEGGDEDALHDLGMAYFQGLFGLSVNLEESERCFRQAIAQGHQRAKDALLITLMLSQDPSKKEEIEQLFLSLNHETRDFFLNNLDIISESSTMQEEEDKSILEAEAHKEISPILTSHELALEQQEAISLVLKQPFVETIPSLPKLSRKKKAALEESERPQKKFNRLLFKIENIKKGKPEKWRKVEALMNQSMKAIGGEVKKSKSTGSGRRIHLGNVHSGFHQTHKSDIKAGALKGMKEILVTAVSNKNN